MRPFLPALNPAQAMGLPAVYIEKIKLMPPDRERGMQDVQIDLSLQVLVGQGLSSKASALKTLNGSYRVFVAFCKEADPIMKLKTEPLWAKTIIKNVKMNEQILKKHYLKPNWKGQRAGTVVVGKNGVVVSQRLRVVESFSLEDFPSLYFCAIPYGADRDSTNPSGFEGKIRSMRLGVPTCQIILNNGSAHLSTTLFQINENPDLIWPGPVHYHEDLGYMAGPTHTNQDHPRLTPLLVSNQKFQDLRFIEFVNQLDFTLSEGAYAAATLGAARGEDPDARRNASAIQKIIRTPRYVSDASYSRMYDNSLKVFFSIDYGRLAYENSNLGYLIQNPSALYSSYSIENIKIYRTRINANVEPNELTPGKVTICGSGQRKPAEEDVLVATLGAGVNKLGFRNLNGNILALAVTDTTMANYNFGTYEYRAVIETVDDTNSAVKNILNKLQTAFSRYDLYYSEISGYDKPGAGVQNMPLAGAVSQANTSWKDLIGVFLGAVEFIFGTEAMKPSPTTWRKNLVAMVNPANRDTSSMLRVKTLIGDFIANLRMISAPPTQPTSDGGSDVRSKIDSQNSATRKIILDHVFTTNYTSAGPASEGMDYLSANLIEQNGALINIGYNNFINRVEMELSKFTLPRANDPGINQYGFLTPASINTQGSVIETNTVNLASSLGSGILGSSLDSNSPTRPPTAPNSSDTVYFNDLSNILLSAGISVEQTTLPLGAVLRSRGKDVNVNTQESSKFLSDSSPFAKDDSELKTTLSGSNEFKMNISKELTDNVLQSGIVEHLVNMRAINFNPPTDYIPPDNAGGSLSAESAAQNPDSLDENSTFGQSINFNSVAEIQYFAGYPLSETMVNLNAPMWKTLSRETFAASQTDNAPLLCRLVLMTPSLNMPNNYQLPLYNQLFLLGASGQAKSNLDIKGATYGEFFKSLAKTQEAAAAALVAPPNVMINSAYMHVPLETAINAPLVVGTTGDTDAPTTTGAINGATGGGTY